MVADSGRLVPGASSSISAWIAPLAGSMRRTSMAFAPVLRTVKVTRPGCGASQAVTQEPDVASIIVSPLPAAGPSARMAAPAATAGTAIMVTGSTQRGTRRAPPGAEVGSGAASAGAGCLGTSAAGRAAGASAGAGRGGRIPRTNRAITGIR